MSVFSLVFTCAVVGFANVFYILALNGINYENCKYPWFVPEKDECNIFTGENIFKALLYSFRTGLGDFGTDSYDSISYSTLIWLVFIACIVLL
jgi:hypothetical protein